jgi:hypothetical protein
MTSKQHGLKLREGVSLEHLQLSEHKKFELFPIREQAQLLIKAVWILNAWPKRFIDICNQQHLYCSPLLHDFEPAPFWFWKVVTDNMYHPDVTITDEEIQSAARYMKKQEMSVSEFSLSKMLGTRDIFRKRKMKIGDLQV